MASKKRKRKHRSTDVHVVTRLLRSIKSEPASDYVKARVRELSDEHGWDPEAVEAMITAKDDEGEDES